MVGVAREGVAAPLATPEPGRSLEWGAPVVALLSDPAAPSPRTAPSPGRYDPVSIPIDRRTIERLSLVRPDVVVIHASDGFDLVRLTRAIRTMIEGRIVIVAADPAPDELVIRTLDAGADDFIDLASSAVLDARIRAALRMRAPRPRVLEFLHAGDLTIDLNAHALLIDGQPSRCPPVQYEVLLALIVEPGATITTSDLLHRVWGVRPGDVHPRRLRIAISTLRSLLGSGPRRPRIDTVTRVGYRLIVPRSV